MDVKERSQEPDYDTRFGRAIARGILFGVPLMLVGLTLAIWIITDNDLADSFATAFLPGVLLGVFGCGFAGMAAAME